MAGIGIPCGHRLVVLTGPGGDPFQVTGLEIREAADTLATFTLTSAVDVPAVLLEASQTDPNLMAFKPPAVAEKDAVAALRERLRRDLGRVDLRVGAGAGAFFGVGQFTGAAAGAVQAWLRLDIATLIDDPADGAGEVLLAAELRAAASLVVGGQQRAFTYRLSARLLDDGVADLVAGFDASGLSFETPRFLWEDLSLDGLELPALERLLQLNLPVPGFLGDAPQFRVHWNSDGDKPKLHLSLNGDTLEVQTPQAGNGALQLRAQNAWQSVATLTGIGLAVTPANGIVLSGVLVAQAGAAPVAELPEGPWGGGRKAPLIVRLRDAKVTVAGQGQYNLGTGEGNLTVTATLRVGAMELRATEDPNLVLALGLEYVVATSMSAGGWTTSTDLARLEIVQPWPITLVAKALDAAADAAEEVLRLLALVRLPSTGAPPNLGPFLERLGDMAEAVLRWLARQAGAAGRALAGLAEAVFRALGRLLSLLRDAADSALDYVAIEVQLDTRTLALRQILVTPATKSEPGSRLTADVLGVALDLPAAWNPGLLIDFTKAGRAALVVRAPTAGDPIRISTDLWLKRDGAPAEAVRDQDEGGGRPKDRLIELTGKGVGSAGDLIGLITLEEGKARFFRRISGVAATTVAVAPGETRSVSLGSGVAAWSDLDFAAALDVDVKVNTDGLKRVLPFFQSDKEGGGDGGGFLDGLGEYVTVEPDGGKARLEGRSVVLPVAVKLHIAKMEAEADLGLRLDLDTFLVSIDGGDEIEISGKREKRKMLGLDVEIVPKDDGGPETFPQFRLGFGGGDVRLRLHEDAQAKLNYRALASAGAGLQFTVDEFGVSRAGLDLAARVDTAEPVRLGGLDVPFRFDSGALNVRRGQLQSFSIKGHGALPPALVGDAKATIQLAMGRNRKNELVVTGGKAELDKSGDPLVCHSTRFTLSLDAVGLEFVDFERDGGYQFFFTLTGSAQFTPLEGEFTDGILKNLSGLKIEFNKAPLTGDGSKLARSISFLIPIEPPRRTSLWDIVDLEVRGVGFQPQAEEFDGDPALLLAGQVKFTPSADIVSAKFDFQRMAIAGPARGQSLPRLRFDGLTVGLSLGGTASVEGTGYAVDDTLPTIFDPGVLPKDVTARGFLASGKLSIQGWASLTASMGFLEIRQEPGNEPRHAFFLYVKQRELSNEIPTPIGSLYQREVGFGFGFRYTLAAFAAADRVKSVKELIQVLDGISAYQGDLDNVRSWWPEADGDRLTLALNSLFTMSSASIAGSAYEPEAEADLPNPVLFDVTAALRSDLTFFLAARAWIAVNYADWHDSSTEDAWRRKPSLKGYIYLSVPRKEFLGRLVADPQGHVGEHPPLPSVLRQALQAVRWSSTLYIRPGLYHHEFGWPYELGFDLGSRGGDFFVECRGGMILRIEDASILNGWAFRAKGHARFGGEVGSRSFGASAVARADFSVDAKLIAYISLLNRNETLFYGCLGLDVSVTFRIRVWLSFSVFGRDITLEAGFSQSLSISVALELAATPNTIAGRGVASISVSGFGRSLRLGVSFGFNEGVLVTARARVERFLSLGLTASVPDADSGLAPQPARPRGPSAAVADERTAEAAVKRTISDAPSPMSPNEGATAEGRGRAPADFWAILARVPGRQDAFVMTLLPRDHSDAVANPPPGSRSSFFAAPPVAGTPWASQALAATPALARRVDFQRLGPDAAPIAFTLDVNGRADAGATWDAVLARNAQDEPLTLREFATECFVRRKADGVLREPTSRPVRPGDVRLPEDQQARADALNEAARDHLSLGVEDAAAVAIDERRSALLAELGHDLARLATRVAWPENQAAGVPAREASAIDIRDFGLTFLVTLDDLAALFERETGAAPPLARFQVESVISDDGATAAGEVRLFNPPHRMFDVQGPKLEEARHRVLPHGVALDWDLEPEWEASNSLWDDPEFHLKHYRIERVVATPAGTLRQYAARRVTSKAGAPMRLHLDGKGPAAELQWQRLRPGSQFVDDLSDLPPDLRAALLGGDDAARKWDGSPLGGQASARLLYTIVPVDSAGNDGQERAIVCEIERPKTRTPALKRATATIRYRAFGATDPTITLGFLDPDFEETGGGQLKDEPDPGTGRTYRLKVRREQAGPSGLYGSDAVTDARARPAAEDFAALYPDLDTVFDLRLTRANGSVWPKETEARREEFPVQDSLSGAFSYVLFTADHKKANLLKAMGVGAKTSADQPIPVRLAIQAGGPDAPWTPIDTLLIIGEPGLRTSDPSPVAMPVDVFEHPVGVKPMPLAFEDVSGEAGRLLLLHPSPDADLTSLLKEDGAALKLLRDPKRRVATRIRWNARPTTAETERRPDFTAGFDLFQLDVHALPSDWATVAPAERQARVRRLAKPVARVQLGAPGLVRLDPPEVPDFGKVEAFYPSRTLRDEKARPTGRAPWFSGADTFARLPERVVRRSLCLSPDEHLITELFAGAAPSVLEVSLVGWPGTAPELLLAEGAPNGIEAKFASGSATFTVKGDVAATAAISPSQVRRLLRGLVWTGASSASPASVRGVKLAVTAKRGASALAKVDFATDLAPALHPVLADTLDILRYVGDESATGPTRFGLGAASDVAWRRYEPVLEAPPPTQATTVAAWFNEAPFNRDPYGWGALRTLGLAVGLRLYDTALGEYELSADLLPRIADAMAIARDRHGGAEIGSPFVDLLYRDGDLSEVASFDGDAPVIGEAERKAVVEARPLAAIQLALRPVADRFVDVPRPVAYWRVSTEATDFLVKPQADSIVELIDLDSEDLSPILLAQDGDNPLLDGRPFQTERRVGGVQKKKALLLRVVSAAATGAPKPLVGGGEIPIEEVVLPECLTQKGHADPFGRFAELTPTQLKALVNTQATSPAAVAMQRFETWARAKFPESWPSETTGAYDASFLVQVRSWAARFLEHGPGASRPVAKREVLFSLGALERTDPHRVSADEAGVLSVLLLHDDRYDRSRRFAVQPFGRYAQIEGALQPGGPPPRELRVEGVLETLRPFADVSVPRTAPLAPPVILSARRLDARQDDLVVPGHELELVVARHTEEMISEANRAVEGALGYEHTAVGFWREYTAPAWAGALGCLPDLEAAFGSGHRLTPSLSFPEAKPFGDLEERHPDGWRGISVYRMEGLPFFYRTHAVAFAAAGVVVSPVSTATFEEGGYVLREPWAAAHPTGTPTAPPSWRVEVDADDPQAPVIVRFSIPLVRYLDEADDAQWEAWLTHGDTTAARAAFSVPDPAARYEVHLETWPDAPDPPAPLSVSREADLVAEVASGDARYRVRSVGPRLAAPSDPFGDIEREGDGAAVWRAWRMSAPMQVRGDAPPPARAVWTPPPPAPAILAHAQFVLPAGLFGPDGIWSAWAPRTAAQLTITRPGNAGGWAAFPVQVAAARGELLAYLPDVLEAKRLDDLLAPFAEVNSLASWNAVAPGLAEFVAPLPGHPAGLPGLGWANPIRVSAPGLWSWPTSPPADLIDAGGEAARSALAAALAIGVPDIDMGLTRPLLASLRAYVRGWRLARDRGVWGRTAVPAPEDAEASEVGLGVARAPLREPALIAAAAALDCDQLPTGLDVPRSVRLVAADRDAPALGVLRQALEPLFGSGDALEALDRFDQGAGDMALTLRLPGRAHADPAVAAALTTIADAAGWAAEPPDVLQLWRPPSSRERSEAVALMGAGSDLARLFVRAADDQLFGPDRRPAIKVLRGIAAPVTKSRLEEAGA